MDVNSQAAAIVKVLKRKGWTLSTAESITAGGVGAAITEVAGSSAIYQGGFITYSDVSTVSYTHLTLPTIYSV